MSISTCKIILLKTLAVSLVIVGGCKQRLPEKCSLYSKGYVAEKTRMKKERIIDTSFLLSYLDDIILKDSFCKESFIERADLYFSKDSLGKAIANYKRAWALDTGNVYVLYELGMACHIMEHYDSAIVYFQRAIDRKTVGDFVADYPNSLGNLSSETAKYDVESNELIFRQGISLYYANNHNRAYANFLHCVEHGYKLDQSYLYKGVILLERNQNQLACRDLDSAKMMGNLNAEFYLANYCH